MVSLDLHPDFLVIFLKYHDQTLLIPKTIFYPEGDLTDYPGLYVGRIGTIIASNPAKTIH
jgi:hypothetical protein